MHEICTRHGKVWITDEEWAERFKTSPGNPEYMDRQHALKEECIRLTASGRYAEAREKAEGLTEWRNWRHTVLQFIKDVEAGRTSAIAALL